MGERAVFSSSKIMKKGIFLTFLVLVNRSCDRIDFFLSIMGMTGGLYEKAEKNDMRAQYFLENRSFFDKIWE